MEDWQKTAQGKKTVHQIEKCKCCLLTTPVQSSLFKKRTGCVVSRREASTEVKSWAKELSGKKIFTPTQKDVKNIGSVIYKEFDSVCKEQLGKSFGEVMSMVPKAGWQRKFHLLRPKKKSVKKRGNLKKMKKIEKNDVDLQMAPRQSFAARKRQRMVEWWSQKEGKKCPQATEEVAHSQYCGWKPRAANAGCERLEDCELVWEGQGVSNKKKRGKCSTTQCWASLEGVPKVLRSQH